MKFIQNTLPVLSLMVLLSSCYKEVLVEEGAGLSDWSFESHSGSANPDYDVVFNQNSVNRIDLVIETEYWEFMQEQLASIQSGSSGMGSFSDESPIYVPCQFYFNNTQWYNVGVRYKGNSSLNNAGSVEKLPLRFNFNEYENDYPEITGQTFYGFQELSMSSNFDDQSLLREKVVCDLFREFGVPAPRTAFYRVYIDYGEGPVYFGLYTMVEVVFDTMLEDHFSDGSGNCYKPDGDGAKWASSGFTTSDFEVKNGTGDYSDVEAIYSALHDDSRTSNAATWRSNLEGLFDVDGYLKYLAANTTMQNWDTYGLMTHNYYLYTDPTDGLMKWIPWDNNEALQEGKRGGAVALDFSDVSDEWPWLTYIYGDTEYRATYEQYLDDFINGVFEPSKVQAQYAAEVALIEQYVTGSEGETSPYTFLSSSSDFSSAVAELNSHVSQRASEVDAYLN